VAADNIAIADAGMAAFSLFFMQSESFLSHQRRMEHGRNASNCKTLFGIEKIPATITFAICSIRRRPNCSSRARAHSGADAATRPMKDFEAARGRVLIALDGSEYFSREKRGCPRCLTRKRFQRQDRELFTVCWRYAGGPPAQRVLPLIRRSSVPQDGAESKNANATQPKRLVWNGTASAWHELRPVYWAMRLFSSQPTARASARDELLLQVDAQERYEFLGGCWSCASIRVSETPAMGCELNSASPR